MLENAAVQYGSNQRIFQHFKTGSPYGETRREQTVETKKVDLSSDRVTLSSGKLQPAVSYNNTMVLQDGYELLRSMVLRIFEQQGLSPAIPTGNPEPGMEEIGLDELTPEEAVDLVAEDGYFGVEQTSDRIVKFAIGVAGGDPARIEAIKAGVEKGFNEAKKAFGDWLPDISYDTYDKVMEKLDAWVNKSSSAQA